MAMTQDEREEWAFAQAWIEATSREEVNRANRIMGEPEVDPWQHANVREHVNAVIEQAFQMVKEGRVIQLKPLTKVEK